MQKWVKRSVGASVISMAWMAACGGSGDDSIGDGGLDATNDVAALDAMSDVHTLDVANDPCSKVTCSSGTNCVNMPPCADALDGGAQHCVYTFFECKPQR